MIPWSAAAGLVMGLGTFDPQFALADFAATAAAGYVLWTTRRVPRVALILPALYLATAAWSVTPWLSIWFAYRVFAVWIVADWIWRSGRFDRRWVTIGFAVAMWPQLIQLVIGLAEGIRPAAMSDTANQVSVTGGVLWLFGGAWWPAVAVATAHVGIGASRGAIVAVWAIVAAVWWRHRPDALVLTAQAAVMTVLFVVATILQGGGGRLTVEQIIDNAIQRSETQTGGASALLPGCKPRNQSTRLFEIIGYGPGGYQAVHCKQIPHSIPGALVAQLGFLALIPASLGAWYIRRWPLQIIAGVAVMGAFYPELIDRPAAAYMWALLALAAASSARSSETARPRTA